MRKNCCCTLLDCHTGCLLIVWYKNIYLEVMPSLGFCACVYILIHLLLLSTVVSQEVFTGTNPIPAKKGQEFMATVLIYFMKNAGKNPVKIQWFIFPDCPRAWVHKSAMLIWDWIWFHFWGLEAEVAVSDFKQKHIWVLRTGTGNRMHSLSSLHNPWKYLGVFCIW